jgi:hypothetical protein
MALQQTRAKQIRIRLVEPALSALEKYAAVTGVPLDEYIIGAALDYPMVIAANRLKGDSDDDRINSSGDELDQDLSGGPEAA